MRSQINKTKKFYIHTLGCKVNQYESQAMRELLLGSGFKESGRRDAADIYIVNTCTVTSAADRESKNVMGRFYKANPDARIVVTGCLVEKNSRDLLLLPGISNILKNSEKNKIAQVAGGNKGQKRSKRPAALTVSGFKDHSKAYVKIQDGCENKCSYCKVPLVRGRLKSKPVKQIVREVEGLVRNGFREVILTGICLGAWGKDMRSKSVSRSGRQGEADLVYVLKALDKIDGEFRIRLSSIEPKYVTDKLIDYMYRNRRMCAHLHIPFQSGDDDVLKLMNRPYTSATYRAIVERVRAKLPDVAISTDMLVGFPGESQARFNNTVSFVKAIAPSRTHVFTFSRREGTPAYAMKNVVDNSDLRERYDSVNAMATESAHAYKMSFIGKELKVLVESKRDKVTGLLKGYSDNYIQILFAGPDSLMRNIVPVKIIGVDPEKVTGRYER